MIFQLLVAMICHDWHRRVLNLRYFHSETKKLARRFEDELKRLALESAGRRTCVENGKIPGFWSIFEENAAVGVQAAHWVDAPKNAMF